MTVATRSWTCLLPIYGLSRDIHHPAAPGCRPIRTGPARPPGQLGRPRLKGERLPTLKELLGHPATLWNTVTVDWYDGTHRMLQIASYTALWYHKGKSPVPIRWVLIRDPLGEFRPQALLCTDLNVAPIRIIEWFVALAARSDLPRSAHSPGSRDPTSVV